MNKFKTIKYLLPLTLLALCQFPVYAEDIEIYLESDTNDSGMPIVMLSIDLRPNVGATACGTSSTPSPACEFLVAGYADILDDEGEVILDDEGAATKTSPCTTDGTIGGMNEDVVDHLFNDSDYETENGKYVLDDDDQKIPLPDEEQLTVEEKLKDNTLGRLVCTNPSELYDLLKASINYVLYDFSGIKVGVMANHAIAPSPGACPNNPLDTSCSLGGFILKHATAIGETDRFKTAYDALSSVGPPASPKETHLYQGVDLFFELYRYLSGEETWNGHVDSVDSISVPDDSWDAMAQGEKTRNVSISHKQPYESPITEQCSKVHTINFVHGTTNDSNSSNSEINSSTGLEEGLLVGNLKWTDTGIPGDFKGNLTDFERILLGLYDIDFGDVLDFGTDVINPDDAWEINVTSHFFENNNKPTQTVKQWAAAGGGNAYVINNENPELLIEDLGALFNSILSTSTTFVSASVPVNVFNRSQFLNNVYLAIFEAEENGRPRWIGNLKRLALDDANTEILDANDNSAFESNGKLALEALTFWTDHNGFDITDYKLDPRVGGNHATDGQYIDRGGAGQQIPGYLDINSELGPGLGNSDGRRKLYTDYGETLTEFNAISLDTDSPSPLSIAYWNAINATGWATWNDDYVDMDDDGAGTDEVPASLANAKLADVTTAEYILKYTRGYEVNTTNGDLSKRWMMGDPIHSRPVPINYGSLGSFDETNPDIRIIMGSNDGIFRMIKNSDDKANASGVELWGFMPLEMLSIQHDLMKNVKMDPVHPYGIDGAPVVYAADKYSAVGVLGSDGALNGSHGDKVYTFFGLRRGGKSIYALDISKPDEPAFKWKISKTEAIDLAGNYIERDIIGDFDKLGYTFSTPRVVRIKIEKGTIIVDGVEKTIDEDVVALVFAGGYDLKKDDKSIDPGGDDEEGMAIYIVNAESGKLIKKFEHDHMLDSIPSSVTVLDTSGNTSADRIYVGDTGGNIWRADMFGTDPSKWGVYKFANLGRHADGGDKKKNDRRFFHRPDFVKSRGSAGVPFDAVILGSGDRANPKDIFLPDGLPDSDGIPQNHLYMLKDKNTYSVRLDYGDDSTPTCAENVYNTDCIPEPLVLTDLSDLTSNCIQDADVSCEDEGVNNLNVNEDERYKSTQNGWYIRLTDFAISDKNDEYQGEKNLSAPLTLGGSIFFTTYIPKVEFDIAAARIDAGITYDNAKKYYQPILDAQEALASAQAAYDAYEGEPEDEAALALKVEVDTAQGNLTNVTAEVDDDGAYAIAFDDAASRLKALNESDGPSSCGPTEGSGLAYVVDLHNAGATINLNTLRSTTGNIEPTKTKEDRIQHLGSGIPADVVPLGDGKVLLPGGIIKQVPGAGTWRTFWYENM